MEKESWIHLVSFYPFQKQGSFLFNSSPPSAAYIHQWIRSALIHKMAWCLLGTKPLSKPVLGYSQLHLTKLQWNFNQNTILFFRENAYKMSSAKWWPFCPRGRWVKAPNTNSVDTPVPSLYLNQCCTDSCVTRPQGVKENHHVFVKPYLRSTGQTRLPVFRVVELHHYIHHE